MMTKVIDVARSKRMLNAVSCFTFYVSLQTKLRYHEI